MRVLITGGHGFLGRHVAKKLSESNFVVTIGSRYFESDIPHLECDLLDIETTDKLVGEVDAIDCIVHIAGHSRELDSIADPRKYFEQNLRVTLNILELARKYNVKKFVYSSTYLVYGASSADRVDEEHSLDPRSIYAGTKAAGEKLSMSYGYSYGMETTVFRQGLFYGDDDNKRRVVSSMMENARNNLNIEIYGDKVIDFIHVDDASEAYRLLLDKNKAGIFNVGSGKGRSLVDIASFIKNKVNPRISIITHDRRPTDMPSFVADISKAKAVLGFEPKIDLYDFISSRA